MKIYKDEVEIFDIVVSDESYRYRSIMGDNSLTVNFSVSGYIEIPVGSYVDFQGARYTLYKPQNFKKNNTRDYEYTVIFEGEEAVMGWYKMIDLSGRLKFPYTAKPQEHLQLLVDNLNKRGSGWSVGSCIDSAEKLISYNHTTLKDSLRQIAEAFNTEYEIIGKQISLRKVEYNKSNPLALSYGYGNGFKSGVKRDNVGESKQIEILYTQGGDRNIDSSKYGSSLLKLPLSKTLKYDGSKFENEVGFNLASSREYITDELGSYIKRNDKALVSRIEDSLDCTHIYPSRVGTVSAVNVVSVASNFYDIIDNSIPESLDYDDCLMAGEKMTIRFESGMLSGRDFDVSYVHVDRKFKIVPQELDGVIMPDSTFTPAIGDKYAIFGMMLPASYICDDATKTGASWDMYKEAVKYFYDNENPKFGFTGELDGMWAANDWANIGGKLILGGYVAFTDEQFQTTPILIRINAIKDNINKPHWPQIELSNLTVGGGTGSLIKGIKNTETTIEETKKEVIRFAKRGFREAKETTAMLQNSLLNFSGSINPISVQTMQLIAGDANLQYRFVNSKTSPTEIAHNFNFDTDKRFKTDGGIVQHMTLGITSVSSSHAVSEYKFWDIPAFQSAVLDNANVAYYVYLKVSKTNQTGVFYISESAITLEGVVGYYHLLVGILNSEFDGDRSWVAMYGYSELSPSRLTIKKVVSPSGKTYFDLENEAFNRTFWN